jgi:hypothetical protein
MNFFWAEIVDVENDDEKSGRAKIRIMGDQAELKDSDLRYARPLFPVTCASKDGAGATPGYQKGTRVLGMFIDNDKQIPYILATAPSAGKHGSLSQEGRDIPGGISKDPGKFNIKTEDYRYIVSATGERKLDTKSITDFAKKEANGPSKFGDLKTLGSKMPTGTNAIDQIKKVDPSNASGALGAGALSMMKGLQNSPAGKALNMVGAAAFKEVLSQITQNKKQDNNNNLLLRLITLLELVNQVIKTIDSIKPIDGTTYRSKSSTVIKATTDLRNQSLYNSECTRIADLGDKISDTDTDKLVQYITIIKNDSIKLRESISVQIQSLKKV